MITKKKLKETILFGPSETSTEAAFADNPHPQSSVWVKELRETLNYDFGFNHVTESVFASINELHLTQSIICKRLDKANRDGKKTLLFVYYRGGGGLDMRCLDTYAILQNGKAFAIEHFLRDLAQINNCYVFGVLDCPRLRLEYRIEDGFTTKDENIRNLILMYGCKMLQDLKAPCVWTIFNLMKKKRKQADDKFIILPEQLLFMERDKYADVLEDIDLEEEKRWEYMTKMHKQIDMHTDCSRPLHLLYGETFKPRKAVVQKELKFFDSDTESEEEESARKKELESARLFKSEMPVEKKYEQVWVPKTKLEKTTDYMHKRSNATNVLNLGNKAGLHLNQIKLGEREQALIVDDTYELKILDQETKKVVHTIPIPST